jgi:hypothetical protein
MTSISKDIRNRIYNAIMKEEMKKTDFNYQSRSFDIESYVDDEDIFHVVISHSSSQDVDDQYTTVDTYVRAILHDISKAYKLPRYSAVIINVDRTANTNEDICVEKGNVFKYIFLGHGIVQYVNYNTREDGSFSVDRISIQALANIKVCKENGQERKEYSGARRDAEIARVIEPERPIEEKKVYQFVRSYESRRNAESALIRDTERRKTERNRASEQQRVFFYFFVILMFFHIFKVFKFLL